MRMQDVGCRVKSKRCFLVWTFLSVVFVKLITLNSVNFITFKQHHITGSYRVKKTSVGMAN